MNSALKKRSRPEFDESDMISIHSRSPIMMTRSMFRQAIGFTAKAPVKPIKPTEKVNTAKTKAKATTAARKTRDAPKPAKASRSKSKAKSCYNLKLHEPKKIEKEPELPKKMAKVIPKRPSSPQQMRSTVRLDMPPANRRLAKGK